MPKKKVDLSFWGMTMFYCPFVMGGPTYRLKRFKLNGGQVIELHDKFTGILYLDQLTQYWFVFEQSSGGLIGDGPTNAEAIQTTNHNIDRTPTLRQQVQESGDIMKLPEMDTEEAFICMRKNIQK